MANYCHIDDSVLRKYIKNNLHDRSLLSGNKYEILCALLIKILFEELYNTDCVVGFKVKQSYCRNRNEIHEPIKDVEMYKSFFNKIADRDTLVDFVVSPVYSFDKTKAQIYCWTFQLKRFGRFQDKKDTDGLLQYLYKIKDKYPKTDSALVVFFDGRSKISFKKICEDEGLKHFPFSTIFFIDFNKNKNNDWHLAMGQMWPIFGYNIYDPIKAVKEGILKNISFKYKNK